MHRPPSVTLADDRRPGQSLPDFDVSTSTDSEPDDDQPGDLILDSRPRDIPSVAEDSAPVMPSAEEIRRLTLIRSLGSHASPTRQLNRLQRAINHIRSNQGLLTALFQDCPTVRSVIYQALHSEFGRDPDQIWLTPTAAPQTPEAPAALTLTEAAARWLGPWTPPANLDQENRLTDPQGTLREGDQELLPSSTLQRIRTLNLREKITNAINDYWADLAPQSHLSRQEQAADLRKRLIADKALLHHAEGHLSDEGLAMFQNIVELPTQASRRHRGGEADTLRVSSLAWEAGNATWLTFAGVLVIEHIGYVKTGLVAFFPGIGQELYEFESAAQLQSRVAQWLAGTRKNLLWHLLPLNLRHRLFGTGQQRRDLRLAYLNLASDAFAYSAKSSLNNQSGNEIVAATLSNQSLLLSTEKPDPDAPDARPLDLAQACASWRRWSAGRAEDKPLAALIARLAQLDSDAQHADISFGQLSAQLPDALCHAKVHQQEATLLPLLEHSDPQGLDDYLSTYEQWRTLCRQSSEVLKDFDKRFSDPSFWREHDPDTADRIQQLADNRNAALLKEIDLLRRQKILSDTEASGLTERLQTSGRNSAYRIASLDVGRRFRLLGAFVIRRQPALDEPQAVEPSYLYLPGDAGGLVRFDSFATLQKQLGNTFKTRPDSLLWHYLPAHQRTTARTQIAQLAPEESWPVEAATVCGDDVMKSSVSAQIEDYVSYLAAVAKGERPFADIDDLSTTQALLAQELESNLCAPPHEARERALANILQVRVANALLDNLPDWLSQASAHNRSEYVERLTRYHQSNRALEQAIEEELPSLEAFARVRLLEQLKRDDLDTLDPQQPIVEFPDGLILSERAAKPIPPVHNVPVVPPPPVRTYSPTPAVTRYSLVELALLNLDPKDSTLQSRLSYLRVLDERFTTRLTATYLSRTLFDLDIAGAYAKAINRAFYASEDPGRTPPDKNRVALLTRPYRLKAELDGWAARQQGLSDHAALMFRTFLAARKPEDLSTRDLDLVLHGVSLGIGIQGVGLDPISEILLVQDTRSGKTLRYLFAPRHTGLTPLSVFPDLRRARQALHTLLDEPGMARFLAESVRRPQDSLETLQRHIEEAAQGRPQPWIWSRPVRHQPHFHDFALNLASDRLKWIRQEASLRATSKAQLLRLRRQRKAARTWSYVRLGLSFVPFVNVTVGVYEVFQAARKVRVEVPPLEVAELVVACAALLFDVAGALAPSRPGNRTSRFTPSRLRQQLAAKHWQGFAATSALDQLSVAPSRKKYLIVPFEGYESDESLAGLNPILGTLENGYFKKGDSQFITRRGKIYAVYRRQGEDALRLKKAGKSFEPALLRTASGEWKYHPAFGLLGGMNNAERQLRRAGWPRNVARQTLDRYRFPSEHSEQLEIELAGYLIRNELIPNHLLRYAITAPSGTAAASPLIEAIARLPTLDALEWLRRRHWERNNLLEGIGQPTQAGHALIYPIAATRPFSALKIKGASSYVEILPSGSTHEADLLFIKGPQPLTEAIADLHKWTTSHAIEQPLPVHFSAATRSVTIHEPLFREPVQTSLRRLFESLSPASISALSYTLIHVSDTNSRGVTTTRLLNLWRTLKGWSGETSGVTPFTEAREPLQLIEGTTVALNGQLSTRPLSLASSRLRGFDALPKADERAALMTLLNSGPDTRKVELVTQAASRVLRNLGYTVGVLQQVGKTRPVSFFIATYRGNPTTYWVSPRFSGAGELRLITAPGSPKHFSDGWFDKQIQEMRDRTLALALQRAKDRQALIGLVAVMARQHTVPESHPEAWTLLIRKIRPT